jgi:signal transduction histidine kinase
MAELIDLADKTMQQIRMLAQDLRPPVLDTFGLNASLEGFCEEFARRANLVIHYEGVDLPSLSGTADISFYRFLQEALNNIAKHAEADETWVRLQNTMKTVCLTIKDNGRGFHVENELAKERAGGLGLLGMQERFELLGGRVEIFSTPGEGTEIAASMPIETENTEENI